MIPTQLNSAAQYRSFTKMAAAFDYKEPVHILGAGSIGLLWAASIRSVFPAYPVQLLLRSHHKDRLILPDSSSHIRNAKVAVCLQSIHNHDSRQKRPPPRTVHVPAALTDATGTPFKNLLLTTKAFQALPAIESIAHRISPQTRIVVLSNGALAIREVLAQFLRERFSQENSLPRIYLAMTTHGAYRDDDDDDDEIFHVIHAGYGKTLIQDCPDLAQLFDLAGLNCESSSTLDRDLWFKLAANCVINPLTAIHRCANGEIRYAIEQARGESFDHYITKIIQEVSQVAQNFAPRAEDKDCYSVQSLKAYVESVIDATAGNKSSMLQDVLAARQTEINYLNGFVVQQGKSLGIQCPINHQLVSDVLALSVPETSQRNGNNKMHV